MSSEIRLPNITATTDAGKLQQVQSYLFQLVEQLNIALKSVDSAAGSNVVMETASSTGVKREQETQASFNSIKALIIKSADIVNAYYDKISEKLTGEYVAQSEFGTYQEITEQTISDHLYTCGQPDVDLLIRTSGEQRLSNFMLYQNAYAEFLFPTVLWPDFTVHDYDEALEAFAHRQRRFGGR